MLTAITALSLGTAAYVYAGYPVAVAVLARLRPLEGPYDRSSLPAVSLVISALDERAGIAAKLANTAELDYPDDLLQVIVVTDGSTDGTDNIARRCASPGTLVIHEDLRRGKAAAMRRGVEASDHGVVVFSDANNSFPPDALRELVAPFSDPSVAAVTGAKVPRGGSDEGSVGAGERLYWRYESFVKRQESRLGCCTGVIGELLAVRRDAVPVFPADLVNDDFFLAMQVARQGYKVAYAPRASSFEPPSTSLADESRRRRRMVAGRWQSLFRATSFLPVGRPLVLWQVVSHKYLRLLLPFTMATGLAASAADVVHHRGRGQVRVAVLVGQSAFYLLGAFAPVLPRSTGPARQVALVSRYLVRTNWSSVEGLLHYATHRRRLHLWERVSRDSSEPGTSAVSADVPPSVAG